MLIFVEQLNAMPRFDLSATSRTELDLCCEEIHASCAVRCNQINPRKDVDVKLVEVLVVVEDVTSISRFVMNSKTVQISVSKIEK